jgi:hypothetical protein
VHQQVVRVQDAVNAAAIQADSVWSTEERKLLRRLPTPRTFAYYEFDWMTARSQRIRDTWHDECLGGDDIL